MKKKNMIMRRIVMGEVIVLLLLINGFMIYFLDRLTSSEVSKEEVKRSSTVMDSSVGSNAVKATEKPEETKKPSEAELLQSEAKKLAVSMDEKVRVLVNKENKIPDGYKADLVTYKGTGKRVAEDVYEPLKAMIKAGEEEGLSFDICSAYRSSRYQEKLFKADVSKYKEQGMEEEEAEEKAACSVQPAGYSEHATGLAVDIIAKGNARLDKSQEDTEEFQWLKKNCYKYGFILRYPSDKTEITGIIYEPWHFRYVGKKAAEFIMKNSLTYEEFYKMAWGDEENR